MQPTNQKYTAAFIDAHRYINVDYEWWDHTEHEFRRVCETLGIDLDRYEPRFSGFCCQGDGASWAGTYMPRRGVYDTAPDRIRTEYPKDEELQYIADELCLMARLYRPMVVTVDRHRDNYVHEHTMQIGSIDYYDADDVDMDDMDVDLYEHIESTFLDLFQRLARWYYATLDAEHDYLTSDEAVIELLEANEIEEID